MLCSICFSVLPVGNQLCSECGATIDRVERQVKATERVTEIRAGAALCAGVEGYIRLCEVLPLQEVGAIVNEYLERLLPQIQADGGQINWYNGEKIVAYFGLSDEVSSAEAPARAVQAALRLHETFAQFNEELLHSYARDLELELRVGVASGELLRGTLGDAAIERPAWSRRGNSTSSLERSQPRYRRVVIGDVMNLAVQLEYEARPGHILTDLATREAAPEFEFKPLGPFTVRRRAIPIEVFSVIGPCLSAELHEVFNLQLA